MRYNEIYMSTVLLNFLLQFFARELLCKNYKKNKNKKTLLEWSLIFNVDFLSNVDGICVA